MCKRILPLLVAALLTLTIVAGAAETRVARANITLTFQGCLRGKRSGRRQAGQSHPGALVRHDHGGLLGCQRDFLGGI